jgi:hypothetical protein
MAAIGKYVSLAQLTRLGPLFNELTSIDRRKSVRLPRACTSGFQPDTGANPAIEKPQSDL